MRLALELINSQWWFGRGAEGLTDRLDDPAWVDEFLARWDLSAAGRPAARDKSKLVELRRLLRAMFTTLAEGRPVSGADVETLNRFIERGVYYRRVTTDGAHRVELVPAHSDWRWVLAEIAASFGELLADGDPSRLKECENPECRWAFYDASKNRRRRWCDPTQCGNVHKVRQFRARQRNQSVGPQRRSRMARPT
jgi:predicted RNA-binding Zn ribbon-like protein